MGPKKPKVRMIPGIAVSALIEDLQARDLFDLGLVIETAPDELRKASPLLVRNRDAFLGSISARRDIVEAQFAAIAARDYRPTFEACFRAASSFLNALERPARPGLKLRR